jgi:ankyrin repeat protein
MKKQEKPETQLGQSYKSQEEIKEVAAKASELAVLIKNDYLSRSELTEPPHSIKRIKEMNLDELQRPDLEKNTPLHYAIGLHDWIRKSRHDNSIVLRIVQQLLKKSNALEEENKRAFINAKNLKGETALHLASCSKVKNAHKIMKQLLNNQADPHAQDISLLTPVHNVCMTQNLDPAMGIKRIRVLLKAKALIDTQDINGYSPLYYALINENDEVAKALVNNGARITENLRSKLKQYRYKKESFITHLEQIEKEALFISSGRISASREASDGASIADAIAGSPLAESLVGGRKLTKEVNKAEKEYEQQEAIKQGVNLIEHEGEKKYHLEENSGNTLLHTWILNGEVKEEIILALINKIIGDKKSGFLFKMNRDGKTPIDLAEQTGRILIKEALINELKKIYPGLI